MAHGRPDRRCAPMGEAGAAVTSTSAMTRPSGPPRRIVSEAALEGRRPDPERKPRQRRPGFSDFRRRHIRRCQAAPPRLPTATGSHIPVVKSPRAQRRSTASADLSRGGDEKPLSHRSQNPSTARENAARWRGPAGIRTTPRRKRSPKLRRASRPFVEILRGDHDEAGPRPVELREKTPRRLMPTERAADWPWRTAGSW